MSKLEIICFRGALVRGPRELHNVIVISRPKAGRAPTHHRSLLDKRLLAQLQLPPLAAYIACKGYGTFGASTIDESIKAKLLVAHQYISSQEFSGFCWMLNLPEL
jgi:hypothetical protein